MSVLGTIICMSIAKPHLNTNQITFLIVVFIMGMSNMFGTQIPSLSLIASLIQYFIVIALLVSGDYAKSFIYYLAFTGIIIDSDIFVYGSDSTIQVDRYTFNRLPLINDYLRWLIVIAYAVCAYKEYKNRGYHISRYNLKFAKWLILLFVTGTISVFFGLISNDNNVLSYPSVYPKQAIIFIILFFIKASTIFVAIVLTCRNNWIEKCSDYLQLILVALALISGVSAILGFTGHYGFYDIVISPVAIGLTPVLLTFASPQIKSSYSILSVFAAIFFIIVSFIYGGTVVGSKWYVIIGLSVICIFVISLQIKSIWTYVFIGIGGLLLIPLILDPLAELFFEDDYVGFKLTQALEVLNIFGADNASDWYSDMNASPLQRFDELHNIFIEYTHKPWYALFGKGLGGTTCHYTNLLTWSGAGDFSDDQIIMKAFYRMHESLAVLFLQHGFAGVVFFVYMLGLIIKRLYKSPWAIASLVWFFFYWDYGTSIFIGAIMMVLTLSINIEDKKQKGIMLKK